jgi:HK97 family phage portal protein
VKIASRVRAAFAKVVNGFRQKQTLSPVSDRGWYTVFESFTGAWQRNVEINQDRVLSHPTVYACVTLIASDIGKLALRLMAQHQSGIWQETTSAAFSPVLRKPNNYQTRQQFIETWVVSKLIHGNAYILLATDNRNTVSAMYVLDPTRVKPLVAPDGTVYYQLNEDDLSGVHQDMPAVPAEWIIHDRMECLFHPLVGTSPLYACGLAATQGLNISSNATQFFGNRSQPGGVLTAPDTIDDTTAARIKAYWEANYTGENAGRIAVLGDGLQYMPMSVNAADSQMVEQSEDAAKMICSAFHVPAYMVGVGDPPPYNNTAALNQHYYDKCLHKLIDSIENGLDLGLDLMKSGYRAEFDLRDLLRMDAAALMSRLGEGVKHGIIAPNEARAEIGYAPVDGGDKPYLQQQNYSLEALAKRDATADPFATAKPPAAPAPTEPAETAAKAALESIERLATAAIQKQQEPTAVTPADDSAKEAVASMERLAAAAIQKEAPDHFDAIKALIDGLAEKQAKAVDDLSRRVESLSEKDDDVDAYADLLTRMTARFEAAHVA